MRFQVKAVKSAMKSAGSSGGAVVSLSLDARDDRDADQQARSQGYVVLGVRRTGSLGLPAALGAARFPLVLFTQELLALLRSGISLVEALETLNEKESKAGTALVLAGLLGRLREGQSFSAALQSRSDAFPDLYVATVRASERTGSLPEALSRFVTYQTQLDAVKKHLVSASIYPLILIAVGGLVSLFLLGYVVPRFSHIYEDIGGDLPWLTRVLMAWGGFVEANGGLLLGAVIDRARRQDYHTLIGGIDAQNEVRIALHRRFGFERCGHLRHAGFKFGRWLDLDFYQLILDTPAHPVDG